MTTTAPRPRRQAALRRLGVAAGYRVSGDRLFLDLTGPVSAHGPGGIVADEVERRLEANRHVVSIVAMLDSPGGQVGAAQAIYAAVRRHPARIKSCIIGDWCASAGVIVFAGFDHREASPRSKLLLHGSALDFDTGSRGTAAEHRRRAEFLAATDDAIASTLAQRCGVPAARIRAEMQSEAPMDARRGLALRLIHSIEGAPVGLLASRAAAHAEYRERVASAVRAGLSPGRHAAIFGHLAFSRAATRYGGHRG